MQMRLLLFFYICFLVSPAFAGLNSKDDLPGLKYEIFNLPGRQIVHALQVDPKLFQIKLVRAAEIGNLRESVATIAKASNAVAAINGGFFRMHDLYTAPAGVLKQPDRWHGIAYRIRGAIGWNKDASIALIDRIDTHSSLHIKGQSFKLHSLNMPPRLHKNLLYSLNFLDPLSKDNVSGPYLLLTNNAVTYAAEKLPTSLPENSYLSIPQKDLDITVGDSYELNISVDPVIDDTSYSLWNNCDYILGGAPLLIKSGVIIKNYDIEKLNLNFIDQEYARTAVGILENGNWLFIIAEKNSLLSIHGMTIPELATLMQQLGCIDAVNLDGGGSSTLYLHDKIINHLEEDEDESFGFLLARKVTDALVIQAKEN